MTNESNQYPIDSVIDNSQLQKNAKDVINAIKEIGDSAVAEAARIDNAFQETPSLLASQNEIPESLPTEQGNMDLMKKLLKEYQTYADRRLEIESKFNADVKAMEAQNTDGKYDENIEVAKRKKVEDLKKINDEEAMETSKHSDLLIKLFDDASKMTRVRMKQVIAETKPLISYFFGDGDELPQKVTPEMTEKLEKIKQSPDELKNIYDNFNKITDEFDKKTSYPFSGIIKGIKNVRESSKEMKAAFEETDVVQKNMLASRAEERRTLGMKSLSDGAAQAAGSIKMISDALNELGQATGDEALLKQSKVLAGVAQNFSAAGQGAAAGGWIGAIVGGATDIIGQVMSAFVRMKAFEEQAKEGMKDFAHGIKMLSLKVDEKDYENIFGVSALSKSIDAYNLAQTAAKEYFDSVNKEYDPEITGRKWAGDFDSSGNKEYVVKKVKASEIVSGEWEFIDKSKKAKAELEAYKNGYNALEAMMVKTRDRIIDRKDEYKGLKDLAPELWEGGAFNIENAKVFLETNKQITEEQKKQIEEVIGFNDAYEEALAILRNDLADTFGNLGSDFTNALVDAVENGTNAWEAFEEAGANSLEKLGKKLVTELFFSKKFNQLQTDLEAAYNASDDPEKIAEKQMAVLDSFFDNIQGDMTQAQTWMENWKAKGEEAGFNLWEGAEAGRETTQKGLASMSQDSANELNGRFASLQVLTTEINESVKFLAGNSQTILLRLTGIENNTAHLNTINDNISYMSRDIRDLKDTVSLKGVKML